MPRPMSETAHQSRLIDTAILHGWRVAHFRPARTEHGWRTPVEGHTGLQDLVLARAGVVLLAECKKGGGRWAWQPGQREWRDAAGPHSRLWVPENWEEALAELSRPLSSRAIPTGGSCYD